MDVQSIISLLIAAGSIGIAFVTLWKNSHKSTKEETKETIEVRASLQSQIDIIKEGFNANLQSIDNGVRDLKADNRSFRSDLTKMRDELRDEIRDIHDEAKHAIELAEAAHRRLDRMGAEPDVLVQKVERN